MFELGKLYDVVMLELNEINGEMSTESNRLKVVSVEFPLVKFKASEDVEDDTVIIVNTASLAFVSAQAVDLNRENDEGKGFAD